MKSVLIVDDHPLVRSAVRGMFKSFSEWQVSGEAEDGRDAIEKAERLKPDLIILDLAMPVLNGLDAAPMLKRTIPSARIIMLTAHNVHQVEQLAQKAGIDAVVSKSQAGSELIHRVQTLLPIG